MSLALILKNTVICYIHCRGWQFIQSKLEYFDVFGVLAVMKSFFFWDKTPCNQFKVNRRFGSAQYLFNAGFLLGLSVHPEAGGNMFLRNVA
jgi:hypothetical protein